jgi:transposase, IS4 family protein
MMSETLKSASSKWYFTTLTNPKGYVYLYAYKTKWDPLKKRSYRSAKCYVGRLCEDNSVRFSSTFLEKFPEYNTGDQYFFGADKRLVIEAAYRADFPEKPGPKPDPEDVEMDEDISYGLTWAAETIAKDAGILDHLQAQFGRREGLNLLHQAIYELDVQGSFDAYRDWRQSVCLHGSEPLSGQAVSDLLSRVTDAKFADYFQMRHSSKVAAAKAKARQEKRPEEDALVHYALDSTSISTYSETISIADWGHSKQGEDLRQINYAVVCDQADGEIVYAHAYNGAIPDVASLTELLTRLSAAKFDLKDVVLVTDRGYSSILNVQKMLNMELRFVQGVRVLEDTIKRDIVKYDESLRDIAFYDSDLDVYARTVEEPWQQNTGTNQLTKHIKVHLMRFPCKTEESITQLVKAVDKVIRRKEDGKTVSSEDWRLYGRYVREYTLPDGKREWRRCNEKIKESLQFAGNFAIRTNEFSNPFDALRVYQQRQAVEFDFNQLKNAIECSRLRCTEKTYRGKLFVCTLATSLRLMMLQRIRSNETAQLRLRGDSLPQALMLLRRMRAVRHRNANRWVAGTITKKQRDVLMLLGLPLPPKILSC